MIPPGYRRLLVREIEPPDDGLVVRPIEEILDDILEMRLRIWRKWRHNVTRCKACGERIIFVKQVTRIAKKTKWITKVKRIPVTCGPQRGQAKPWHTQWIGGAHSRHVCESGQRTLSI